MLGPSLDVATATGTLSEPAIHHWHSHAEPSLDPS